MPPKSKKGHGKARQQVGNKGKVWTDPPPESSTSTSSSQSQAMEAPDQGKKSVQEIKGKRGGCGCCQSSKCCAHVGVKGSNSHTKSSNKSCIEFIEKEISRVELKDETQPKTKTQTKSSSRGGCHSHGCGHGHHHDCSDGLPDYETAIATGVIFGPIDLEDSSSSSDDENDFATVAKWEAFFENSFLSPIYTNEKCTDEHCPKCHNSDNSEQKKVPVPLYVETISDGPEFLQMILDVMNMRTPADKVSGHLMPGVRNPGDEKIPCSAVHMCDLCIPLAIEVDTRLQQDPEFRKEVCDRLREKFKNAKAALMGDHDHEHDPKKCDASGGDCSSSKPGSSSSGGGHLPCCLHHASGCSCDDNCCHRKNPLMKEFRLTDFTQQVKQHVLRQAKKYNIDVTKSRMLRLILHHYAHSKEAAPTVPKFVRNRKCKNKVFSTKDFPAFELSDSDKHELTHRSSYIRYAELTSDDALLMIALAEVIGFTKFRRDMFRMFEHQYGFDVRLEKLKADKKETFDTRSHPDPDLGPGFSGHHHHN